MFPERGFTHGGLEVHRSKCHGYGVFATEDIAKNTPLTCFQGDLVHRDEVEFLPRNAKRYIIRVPHDHYVNGEPYLKSIYQKKVNILNFGVGDVINAAGSARSSNCKLKHFTLNQYLKFVGQPRVHKAISDASPPVPVLMATKDVREGDELFWNYPVHL